MTLHLAYDASTPEPDGIPGTDTVLIYCGGDTPHDWTNAEIDEQPERYRLPTWVRSDPAGDSATDAASFISWLQVHGVPKSTSVVLDLETAVDPAYVSRFGALLNAAGYFVLPYGSTSTIKMNPVLNGYFVAEPGATGMYPGSVATQFAYRGSYDLSWILDSVTLWDTHPIPAPPPAWPAGDIVKPLAGKFGALNAPIVAQIPTASGDGYTLIGADGGTFNYGDAPFLGSLAGMKLAAPIVDGARSPGGMGLVLVGTDGGVFSLGTATFEGSEGGQELNAPVSSIALTPSGKGYWLTAADGGVFTFGDAPFKGSAA